ncbi:MAG TPA: 50S ribosomal protein L11 methyltransferase [Rhodocyclaceae bacterium]|nr:50S ribosomal protein L11 methyltransferase [Rhodocyclaceae bacterium]
MWIQVNLHTDAAHAERLADALMEIGAISASIEDAQAGTPQETPQFGEPGSPAAPLWEISRVIALFEPGNTPQDDLRARIDAATQGLGLGTLVAQFSTLDDQDWVRLTQAEFPPICVGDRLWIVPSWHTCPDPSAIHLKLDPGLAFGTGSHPTTFLCLEWLLDTIHGGETLLDYGCGSGILAIAAAKLGARTPIGIDIDPNALSAAQDNALHNEVALELHDALPPHTKHFDRVVANILTQPLCDLAAAIASQLAPHGRLALSGVLEEQAPQVIAAYAPYLRLHVAATRDGWVRLEGGPC